MKNKIIPVVAVASVLSLSLTYAANVSKEIVSAQVPENAFTYEAVQSIAAKKTQQINEKPLLNFRQAEEQTLTEPEPPLEKQVQVKNLNASAISVSSIKLTWNAEAGREYKVGINTNAPYSQNIRLVRKADGYYYATGLRENSEYQFTVTPVLTPIEQANGMKAVENSVMAKTVDEYFYWEYQKEEGWTNCFAGEPASGLTLAPAKNYIAGSIVDPVTGTGIRRNEYGDYCVAMGLWYGLDGDRFLIELENGTQFTVEMCDSKGWGDDADGDGINDGRFHWFGYHHEGKCIVEFIYDDNYLPATVAQSGSWGFEEWSGLDLTANIAHIYRIGYGNEIQY